MQLVILIILCYFPLFYSLGFWMSWINRKICMLQDENVFGCSFSSEISLKLLLHEECDVIQDMGYVKNMEWFFLVKFPNVEDLVSRYLLNMSKSKWLEVLWLKINSHSLFCWTFLHSGSDSFLHFTHVSVCA